VSGCFFSEHSVEAQKTLQLTGVELDLAEHDPARVELELNGERAGDEVMKWHGHWPGGLGQRVTPVLEPHPAVGRRGVMVADPHRGRGKDADVALKQIVDVHSQHAEVPHTVESTHPHHHHHRHHHHRAVYVAWIASIISE